MNLQIYKKLGNALINSGIGFLKSAFAVKLKQTNSVVVRDLLSSVGIKDSYFTDGTYWYTDLQTVKDILLYDTTNDKKYVIEQYDCDDFSLTVRNSFREYYGINCMGEIREIQIWLVDTGKLFTYHRANIFLAEDEGKLKVYLLEASNDRILEITKDNINNLVIGNWKYVLGRADF